MSRVEIAGQQVPGPRPDLVIELDPGVRLAGRVTDEGGRPIRGARVRALHTQGEDAKASREAVEDATLTDGQGRFGFDALPTGPTTLYASAEGRAPAAKSLVVGGSDPPPEIILRALTRLVGTVGRRLGGPVADAEVSLGPLRPNVPRRSRRRCKSGPDGRFAFSGVERGVYRLRVALPGGGATERVVTVDDSSPSPVLVEIGGGLAIHGQILGLTAEECNKVGVSGRMREGRVEAPVDPEGRFVLEDLPPGDITLFASLATAAGTRSASKSLSLTRDEPVVQAELAFSTGSASALTGFITRGGEPLSGRLLFLRGTDDPPGSRSATTSDASGGYAFDRLGDGRYELYISTSAGVTLEQEVDVRGWTRYDVEIRAARLVGRVVGSTTGEPIGDAAVRLIGPADRGSVRAVQTEADGRFAFADLSPGEYSTTAEAKDWVPGGVHVLVRSESDSAEVDIALEREAGLSLRVVDRRTGSPASSLTAIVLKGGTATSAVSLRGSGGLFRVPGLQRGRVDLVALAPGAAPATLLGLTVPGETDVQVSTGGTIRLLSPPALGMASLLRPDGAVQWQTAGSNAVLMAMRLSAPETVLGPIEPGLYHLLITSGAQTRRYEVAVHDGGTTILSLAK